MEYIIGLALLAAASLAVQLLAIVLVILTRPHPRPLLWAFWLSALGLSLVISLVVLTFFRANGTILGETAVGVHPVVFIVIGCIALAAGLFAATERGRALIGREIEKGHDHDAAGDSVSGRLQAEAQRVKARADESLGQGSLLIAVVVGLLLGTPTPYQLAAIGAIVRDGYSFPVQLALIVIFSLITYVVIEVPLLSYAVRPDATATRVAAFSAWLDANKIQVVAGIAAVVGLALILKGVTSL